MNDLELAISAALQAQAQGAAMKTDTPHEQDVLESRLDELDRHTRNRRIVWGAVAAVAAVALVVVALGARAYQGATPAPGPVASAKPLFASTVFGVPFTVQSLPNWLTSQTLLTDGEAAGWVNWNRCPQNGNECIGLSFNRYSSVQLAKSRKNVTYATYLAYLDQLGAAGKVQISGRRETTVDGHRAVVFDMTAPSDRVGALGCSLGAAFPCDDIAAVPARYAVIDTGDLDPTGAVLTVFTRAGRTGPAEVGWLDQFDQMITTLKFTGPTPKAS
jgi:hypothetical protein